MVKNLAFGSAEDFIIFDGCRQQGRRIPVSLGKKALLAKGGVILNMPMLDARSYAWLDVLDLSFLQAVKGVGKGAELPLAHQARVRQWFGCFEAMLAPARTFLGLAPLVAGSP